MKKTLGQMLSEAIVTSAAGAMRAILRADGWVYDRLYMPGELRR